MENEAITKGLKAKFNDLRLNPLPTTELDYRTTLLAEEIDRLKKNIGYLKGDQWAIKQKLATLNRK